MKQIFVITLLSTLVVNYVVDAGVTGINDLGAKLAFDNGLDRDSLTKKIPPGSSPTTKFHLVDKEFVSKLQVMASRWRAMKPAEALLEIDSLIDYFNKSNMFRYTFDLNSYRIYALRALGRYVEALVGAVKNQKICSETPGCNQDMMAKVISETKRKMLEGGHYATLGVQKSASQDDLKKAYRRSMFLLHPDKNVNLDEKSRDYFKDLMHMVQESYGALSQ